MITEKDFKVCGEFNKFVFAYTAKNPVKLFVDYELTDGTTINDYFFLDAGEKTFEALIDGYTEGKKGTKIVRVETKDLSEASDIVFKSAECLLVPVIAEDTCYLSNARYTLGVRLIWGGGINYLVDRECSIDGMTNMINQYDTGRLVQQSYYGCGENGENEWGYFNNSKWPYNPVQGGDRGNMHSRLIDVKVTDKSVYIKAQPRDWGKIGVLTPSYMENTYTLDGDLIRVDNKFTDYSGWKHPINAQELPAFYTVSYLSRFVFYDGDKPWKDDMLSTRDNLHFWGMPEYDSECSFRIKENNDEIWSAWVSPKDDYGIGLYVPETDFLKAGRNAYNDSKDPLDPATNYTAPLGFIGIVSYKPIEYSYLMTCGSVAEIRERFKENRFFAKNESLRVNNRRSRRSADAPDFPKAL